MDDLLSENGDALAAAQLSPLPWAPLLPTEPTRQQPPSPEAPSREGGNVQTTLARDMNGAGREKASDRLWCKAKCGEGTTTVNPHRLRYESFQVRSSNSRIVACLNLNMPQSSKSRGAGPIFSQIELRETARSPSEASQAMPSETPEAAAPLAPAAAERLARPTQLPERFVRARYRGARCEDVARGSRFWGGREGRHRGRAPRLGGALRVTERYKTRSAPPRVHLCGALEAGGVPP